MYRNNRALGALMAILAALANLTVVYVIARISLTGDEGIPYLAGGDLNSFLAALGVVVVLNIASARMRPGDNIFRWAVDFLPSLAVFVVAAVALVAPFFGGNALTGIWRTYVVIVLVWSVVDLWINQGANVNEVLARIGGKPAAQVPGSWRDSQGTVHEADTFDSRSGDPRWKTPAYLDIPVVPRLVLPNGRKIEVSPEQAERELDRLGAHVANPGPAPQAPGSSRRLPDNTRRTPPAADVAADERRVQ